MDYAYVPHCACTYCMGVHMQLLTSPFPSSPPTHTHTTHPHRAHSDRLPAAMVMVVMMMMKPALWTTLKNSSLPAERTELCMSVELSSHPTRQSRHSTPHSRPRTTGSRLADSPSSWTTATNPPLVPLPFPLPLLPLLSPGLRLRWW